MTLDTYPQVERVAASRRIANLATWGGSVKGESKKMFTILTIFHPAVIY